MAASRVALLASVLLAVAAQSPAAAAGSPAPEAAASSSPWASGKFSTLQYRDEREKKKKIILGIAFLISVLDIYEIVRHHHHPHQPVSP